MRSNGPLHSTGLSDPHGQLLSAQVVSQTRPANLHSDRWWRQAIRAALRPHRAHSRRGRVHTPAPWSIAARPARRDERRHVERRRQHRRRRDVAERHHHRRRRAGLAARGEGVARARRDGAGDAAPAEAQHVRAPAQLLPTRHAIRPFALQRPCPFRWAASLLRVVWAAWACCRDPGRYDRLYVGFRVCPKPMRSRPCVWVLTLGSTPPPRAVERRAPGGSRTKIRTTREWP